MIFNNYQQFQPAIVRVCIFFKGTFLCTPRFLVYAHLTTCVCAHTRTAQSLRGNTVHHSQSHNPVSSYMQLRIHSSIQLLFKQYSFFLVCYYLGKNCYYLGKNSFISQACTWIVIALSIQLHFNKDFLHMKQHKRYLQVPLGYLLFSWHM